MIKIKNNNKGGLTMPKIKTKKGPVFLLIIILMLFIQENIQVNQQNYLSPESVVADQQGKFVYVAMLTADYVAVIDAQTETIIRKIRTPEGPTGLALSPIQPLLYVTGGVSYGKVYEIDLGTDKIISEIKVGHSPAAPVVSPDGKTLYVSNRFNNNVAVINLAKHIVIQNIPVPREPVAAAITSDGKLLFIANFLPDVPSDADYVAASVSVINTSDHTVLNNIRMPNGSTDLHGMVISPDSQYLYVTHQIASYNLLTNQIERGWMNKNVFTIIDIKSQKIINSILLDDLDMGAANPWGVTVSNDGASLVMTHAGTHEISLIDRVALHAKLDRIARGEGEQVTVASARPEDVPYDFSFLVGLRNRIRLKGNGPRGVTIAGGKIFVAEYFSGSLGIIDLHDLQHPQSKSLGEEPEMSAERRGEMLFNDATKCFQMWQSCASCHPDGRMDGLNWDLLNDGIGNPKNTKSLLLSHKTPPVMAYGIRENAEAAVRSGFKYILFAPLPENEASMVDEYLKNMKPIPSPYLVNGNLSDRAQRGKKLFEQIGCNNCHSGPYYTNMKSYDVGTLRGWEKATKKPLDVPSLIEVWRTAPYLHDGRAMTVQKAFSACHPEGLKGLSPDDIKALSEYVLSL
jgi:YVTN family beta-propeller protein